MAFLSKLHVFALDVLRLVIIAIVNYNAKLIKLVKAIIRVLVSFSLFIITFSSLFMLALIIHELIEYVCN